MAQRDLFRSTPRPWNSGRIIGPKWRIANVTMVCEHKSNLGEIRVLALIGILQATFSGSRRSR